MVDWRITHIPSIASTMDWVRDHARAGSPDFTGIRADEQTAGRGRVGRTWSSPAGNLYFSFLIHTGQNAGVLPLALAIALHDTLRGFILDGITINVKWPNDVLVDGRKIAGILIEREGTASLVGMGVNIAHAPEDKAALSEWSGASVDEFFLPLQASIAEWTRAPHEAVIARWNELAAYKDQEISFRQGMTTLTGTFLGVDASGYARIASGDVVKTYASGEVMEVRPCS